jgi:hypothetical protein
MSNFQITFTLKQHTPIIHFQADQPGATLRATELKPKLDRFLIEHFEKEGIAYDRWLINGRERALDYKVRIEPIGKVEIVDIEYHKKKFDRDNKEWVPAYDKKGNKVMATLPTFFANMGEEWKKNPKKLSWSPEGIKVTITTFYTDLADVIRERMSRFVATHNFGMRQSKGFGSFSVVAIDDQKVEEDITHHFDYYFDVHINDMSYKVNYVANPRHIYLEMEKLFYAIHRFHQTIRSGINENGFYFKPMMFFYAKEKGHQWDKKTFKQEFLPTDCLNAQKKKYRYDSPVAFDDGKKQHYLFRDLLGLSTSQLWRMAPKKLDKCDRKYGFTIRHPKEKNGNPIDFINGRQVPLNEVKRFQSPFFYKPVRLDNETFRVGIVLKEIPQELFDSTFNIVKSIKQGQEDKAIDYIANMRMYPRFDIRQYFEFIYEQKDTLIKKVHQVNHTIEKEIIIIFKSLTKVST